jgi:hypothetical protein
VCGIYIYIYIYGEALMLLIISKLGMMLIVCHIWLYPSVNVSFNCVPCLLFHIRSLS